MAVSLRTLQSALNGAGFTVPQMNAFFDINPIVLQNCLTGVTANVNNSATLVDAVVSGGGVNTDTLGNALQVEIGQAEALAANNYWFIEGHVQVSTAATQGVKVQITAYDGLQVITALSNISFVLNVNGAASSSGVVAVGSSFGAAVNAVSIDFTGMIAVASGYGRIGLQFAQSAATVANTSLGPYGYMRCEALLT